ncbi:MAG: transglutaminase-like domain-containing protein [Singulisphaera sp.]
MVRGVTNVALAATALAFGHPAQADQPSPTKLKETVHIDPSGNGTFSAEMKLPVGRYTYLKANTPNMALLLRQMPVTHQWLPIEKLSGQFDDTTSSVKVDATVTGLSRLTRGGRWEAPITDNAELELITAHDNYIVMGATIRSPAGNTNLTLHAVLPEGATNVELLTSPARIAYHLAPSATMTGEHPGADVKLEAREQIMTCLAKSYGNPKFSQMWAARCVFKNVGDQTLKNYRIRFRIDGFTQGWSPWQTSEMVLPEQSVIDAFFPMFDVDKLAGINGTRPAILEMELQYEQADGHVVEQNDSRRVQLLGRNEVVFSTLKADEAVGFQDQYNCGPFVLASFVTHEDPVIQQVAGWVSARAGGRGNDTDENAKAFMKALYEFVASNQIAYQTPPVGQSNTRSGQHVKYGRDVLRNRAGTCIDLAILYGSVCEAVGLRPLLTLIPGHCFPAVYLPESGSILAVETTMVGKRSFEDACKSGSESLLKALRELPCYIVDVQDLHNQGVYGLELATLPPSALADWGVRPAAAPAQLAGSRQPHAIRNDRTSGASVQSPVGQWLFQKETRHGTLRYLLVLDEEGHYACEVQSPKSNGENSQVQSAGSYEINGGSMIFVTQEGNRTSRSYRMEDGRLKIHFAEAGETITFARVD